VEGIELESRLRCFRETLALAELSERTVSKYARDAEGFIRFLSANGGQNQISKKGMLLYKQNLLTKYKVSSMNSNIISVNKFVTWLGMKDMRLKTERVQKKSCMENVISKYEYRLLLKCARAHGYEKHRLIMRVLASTGIRVGELKFITREAANADFV
jgi:site-specific recombinase XerD